MTAKVVATPSNYQLVINRGLEDSVRSGERYLIYRRGAEVFDPDTEESLGHFEEVVGRARVVLVNDKNSTLESDDFDTIEYSPDTSAGGSATGIFWSPLQTRERRTERERRTIDAMIGDFAKRI